MFRPSPAPGWEALQESAPTTEDSSQDELDEDDEDDELSVHPKASAVTSGPPLKRKDGGWDIETAAKRLKLREPEIGGGTGSISAPVPKAQPRISNASSSVAGPSKISNPGTSISARAGTSSSMAPPADTSRRAFGQKPPAFNGQNASRSEHKAAASTSSKPTSEAGPSSQRLNSSNRPPSSTSSKKPSAPPAKPKHSENEIIEISSDSDSDIPPPPPPTRKTKIQARKSTGSYPPRRRSPPKRKNEPEIIEILDSDDEVPNPPVAPRKSTNQVQKSAKVPEKPSISKPPSEDRMDLDDAPVEAAAPSARPEREHNVTPATDMIVDLRYTPPSPPANPEPATPAHASSSSSLQPQASPASIKKPNRQGFNPISIPENISVPPSPTKRRLQMAVKSAFGPAKQRETSPSSSSASSSDSTGDSASIKESSNPNSRDSISDPGPDLRSLTDALGLTSRRNSSPEPRVPKKKPPTATKTTGTSGPPKAGSAGTTFFPRKTARNVQSFDSTQDERPSRPPGFATTVARKSTGNVQSVAEAIVKSGQANAETHIAVGSARAVARKSTGNVQSLAEAIMKSGQANAMNAKTHIKPSKGKNTSSLDPARVVSPATAESSKALVNLLSTLKSKPSTPVASSSKVSTPPVSRSIFDEELLVMPKLKTSTPVASTSKVQLPPRSIFDEPLLVMPKLKTSTPVASTSKVPPLPLSRSVSDEEPPVLPPVQLPPPTRQSPSPPPSKSPSVPSASTSEPTSVPPQPSKASAPPISKNKSVQPKKPPIPTSTLIWKTGVPKPASKPPTRTNSVSSLSTVAPVQVAPATPPEDSQALPVQAVDQPPPVAASPSQPPIRDVPLPLSSKPTLFPSLDAAPPPHAISDQTLVSETQEQRLAVQAPVTKPATLVVEQSTATSMTVSKPTEATIDVPAVPDVEMSWNTPSDDEMANDTDECQAMIEVNDDDDIMEVEPISDDLPLEKVASPAQSESSDGDEAGPSTKSSSPPPPPPPLPAAAAEPRRSSRRSSSPPIERRRSSRRSSSPPMELRRSSRRSSRSHSSTEHWHGTFDDDENDIPPVYEPASRNTTPEDSNGTTKVVHKGKTYGGLPAITWKEYRRNLNNFVQKCHYAKDLPHALQDHVNDMSPYTQMMGGMRDLFEAMMLENTVEDEPDAPPIELQNNVDEEPTPPWEFYYTNKMWHGEGVPPPDVKNLISCSCKGVCDPRSKTCACLKNQRTVAADPHLEFAYDKAGRLKIPGYPVFECNDLCGCGDECRNRVVQHGRKVQVSIRKTEHKGWGVFAGNKKIPMGTFIGIYSGELLTDIVAHERGVLYNTYGRTYLFDLDFHHLKPDENDEKYHDWSNKYTVDAYHAGNFTRFLNNSCDPNCRLYPCYINEGNIDKPLLTIFSRRDIEPNEEICFNYQGRYPGDEDDEDEPHDESGSVADDESQGGARDRIYEKCMCGAAKCTGVMFR